MNSYLAVLGIFLGATTLFALPMLPAVRELLSPSDAAPLSVIQQHGGEIRYFADSFRSYLKALTSIIDECGRSGSKETGRMADGTDYLILGSGDEALALPFDPQNPVCPVMIAAATDLSLLPNTTFSKELYSRGRLIGAENNTYRAVLAEKEIHLGGGSVVMRWVHAVGTLTADSGCKLYGRGSSDRRIRLAAGCSFLRLNAPQIETGGEWSHSAGNSGSVEPASSSVPQRTLHDGDFEIRAGAVFQGNLVVRGKLTIGSGARVFGDVKSTRAMVVNSHASVQGSLISAGKLLIGSGCVVRGPVIAEHELFIDRETQCGSSRCPTTISALEIKVAEKVVIFGSLWARERGEVVGKA